jgi:nucleoside-diphosphate-sugar epimerase
MSRILITGGQGFIGSHLFTALLNGTNEVDIMDNKPLCNVPKSRRGDVNSFSDCAKFCAGIDIVYHLAALKDVASSVNCPNDYNATNIQGTVNILEASKQLSVKRVILASSAAVYGNPFWPSQNESHVPKPLSPYAITKLVGEEYCRYYSQVHGLQTLALRFFNVYGPGQSLADPYAGVITAYINQMLRDRAPRIDGDGYQTRDFVSVHDVVNALVLAGTCPLDSYKVCNIGSGQTHNLHDIIKCLNIIMGKRIEPFYAEARKGDVRNSCASIEEAKKLLGYYPEVSFGKGMQELVKHFQEKQND